MEIQALINRQRVKYIIESYHLAGDEAESFAHLLDDLFETYKLARLELALAEVLTESWAKVPMERGMAYLHKVRDRLELWRAEGLTHRLTPTQFEQITGLDASVTFDELDDSPAEVPESQAATASDL